MNINVKSSYQYLDKNALILSESPSIVLSVTSFPNSLIETVPTGVTTYNVKYSGNK